MKRIFILILLISITLFISAQDTRPILDDIGYCWQPAQLERFMHFLEPHTPSPDTELPPLVAGISPHDDYLYAGKAYYALFKQIKAKEVVIFGVTHRSPRLEMGDPIGKIIMEEFKSWQGPYGPVKISGLRDTIKEQMPEDMVMISNKGHKMEHSIEGMLPFLQYFNRDVQITPIMVSGMPYESLEAISSKLAAVLGSYIKKNKLELGKDIFILISADANHYGKDFQNTVFGEDAKAHEQGIEYDKNLAHSYLSGDMVPGKIKDLTAKLWGKTFKDYGNTVWCGKYSIPLGMLTVLHLSKELFPEKQLKGKILQYLDTYSEGVLPVQQTGMGITATFSLKHWVGFFSAGFFY